MLILADVMREVCPDIPDALWLRLNPRERALQVAAWLCDDVKVREVGGNNRGPWVKRILASVGLTEGFAWCAATVWFCGIKAGLEIGPKTGRAAVRNWAAWAEEEGRITNSPERGDLGFWLNADQTGHIFRVVQVVGPWVRTIEGNTGPDGGRDGDGMYRKTRLKSKLRFISMRVRA